MFSHPKVKKIKTSVEIDSSGGWVNIIEISVTFKVVGQNQSLIAEVMQAVVNWAYTADQKWDKLRIIEAD